jgi:hypothetical protein
MIIYKSEVVMIRCHSTRPHIISKDEWQHQHGHGHYSGMVSVCSYGYNWRYHWDCKLMNANTSDVILFSFLLSFKKNYVPLHNIALLVKSNHEQIKRNHEHIKSNHEYINILFIFRSLTYTYQTLQYILFWCRN